MKKNEIKVKSSGKVKPKKVSISEYHMNIKSLLLNVLI